MEFRPGFREPANRSRRGRRSPGAMGGRNLGRRAGSFTPSRIGAPRSFDPQSARAIGLGPALGIRRGGPQSGRMVSRRARRRLARSSGRALPVSDRRPHGSRRMKTREASLTAEIVEKVRALAHERFAEPGRFVPGETTVGYAGRVYDEEELVNLV